MPGKWAGSRRRAELPADWSARRIQVLTRDDWQCTELLDDGSRCPEQATDVDHTGDKHDHRLHKLRSLCSWHHDRKSSQQGNAARHRHTTRRPPEPHPGLS